MAEPTIQEDIANIRSLIKEQLGGDHLSYIADEWGQEAADLAVEHAEAMRRVCDRLEAILNAPPVCPECGGTKGVCSECGRKTYSIQDEGRRCGMTQPDGSECEGHFL